MSRATLLFNGTRAVSAVDTNATIPAAPEDKNGNAATSMPAGVATTRGAYTLAVDVGSVGTTAGNFTIELLAWNRVLQAWVVAQELTIAGLDTVTTPRLVSPRTLIQNWVSDYAFAFVKTFATNTTSATVSIVAAPQDT